MNARIETAEYFSPPIEHSLAQPVQKIRSRHSHPALKLITLYSLPHITTLVFGVEDSSLFSPEGKDRHENLVMIHNPKEPLWNIGMNRTAMV